MRRAILFLGPLLLGAICVQAQQTPSDTPPPLITPPPLVPTPTPDPAAATGANASILFVGNSFVHGKYSPVRNYNADAVTDENASLPANAPRAFHPPDEKGPYGGVPGIFKKMTDEAGKHFDVHVEAVSAKNLEFHYKYALPVIAKSKWAAVVLQEYSTGPLPAARGGRPDNFLDHATRLEKAVHSANPAAKVYLYQTWPRADLIYPKKAPYHGTFVYSMGEDLHNGYRQAFTASGRIEAIACVGDAWLSAIRAGMAVEDPYQKKKKNAGRFDLWGPDHYHPSTHGAYLAALVFFQQFTQIDARTLGPDEQAAHDLGISREDAVRLQNAAETVNVLPPVPKS